MAQPDSITLSVDDDGDGLTPIDEVYTNFDRYGNRSVYHGSDHTPVVRNTMTLYRTYPKATPSFYGVWKTAAKTSQDLTVDTPIVDGTTRAPAIMATNASIPVGATDEEIMHAVQRHIALLQTDEFLVMVKTGKV
jgi:hypothetical protein